MAAKLCQPGRMPQGLPGAQMVSAATYIVGGIQVTASINEELDQGREVVLHSQVHRRGALLGKETRIHQWVPPRTAQHSLVGWKWGGVDRYNVSRFDPSCSSRGMGGLRNL